MRVTLMTLVILASMDADLEYLLWLAAFTPLAAAVTLLGFLLQPRPAPSQEAWGDLGRHGDPRPVDWRPAHRRSSRRVPPGRHEPGRGRWAAPMLDRIGEATQSVDARTVLDHAHEPYRDGVRIRCRRCKLDLDQPEGMPPVGRNGFSSWA